MSDVTLTTSAARRLAQAGIVLLVRSGKGDDWQPRNTAIEPHAKAKYRVDPSQPFTDGQRTVIAAVAPAVTLFGMPPRDVAPGQGRVDWHLAAVEYAGNIDTLQAEIADLRKDLARERKAHRDTRRDLSYIIKRIMGSPS